MVPFHSFTSLLFVIFALPTIALCHCYAVVVKAVKVRDRTVFFVGGHLSDRSTTKVVDCDTSSGVLIAGLPEESITPSKTRTVYMIVL